MGKPDISALRAIAEHVEDVAEKLYLDLDTAIAELARVFGPVAAAHALAVAAIEMAKLAEREGSHENPS